MGSGTKLAVGVGTAGGIMAMMPILLPILILLSCCCSSSSTVSGIFSSISFDDLRNSGKYKKAKEHFEEKKILNQQY